MLTLYLSLIENEEEKKQFEKIYLSYRKQMITLAVSILNNESDAEDVVHDVFLAIASKHMPTILSIKNEKDLRNYILKSTKNTALNLLKKRKILFPVESIVFDCDTNALCTDDMFLEVLCQKEEYLSVLDGMNKLNEKYREVLYYHFVLGMSLKEISTNLGRTIPTIKKQITRGKQMLLNILSLNEEETIHVND